MVPAPFIVVADANVLFPLTLRDTILRAAAAGFYQLRWSAAILDEMERNLVSTGTMPADKAARLRATMETYFPEAEVTGYEPIIVGLQNDEKDRHVVAAAVKAGAQVITTSNLKDFLPLPDGLEAQSPDEFLNNLFDLDPQAFVELLREQAADLLKPPVSLVLTAAHVVSAGSVEVRARGGKAMAGRVVRIARKQDVALIAIAGASAGTLPCLSLDTSPQSPGNDIYAIGSPASEELAFSLSRGIVSGLRSIGDVALIQTDASLSPGNSGGPLVDSQARVVGVVSRKIAGHAVEGLGFAIPIQTALSALSLEPAVATTASLLQHEPLPVARAQPKAAVTDTPDAKPSLDPEGDRARLVAADYQRRLEEQKRRTPAYVPVLRWGGLAVAVTGALGVLVTVAEHKDRMTRSNYESVRLKNDLSWAGVALGSGALVSSFVLAPSLAPSKLQKAGGWSVLASPKDVRMKVSF